MGLKIYIYNPKRDIFTGFKTFFLSGGADICPEDGDDFWVNISNTIVSVSPTNFVRMASVLLPPDNETLLKITQQGYKDAWRFLQTRFSISTSLLLGRNTFKDKETQLKHLRMIFDKVNFEDPSLMSFLKKIPLGSKMTEVTGSLVDGMLVVPR